MCWSNFWPEHKLLPFSVYPFVCLSILLFVHLSVCPPVRLSICPPVIISLKRHIQDFSLPYIRDVIFNMLPWILIYRLIFWSFGINWDLLIFCVHITFDLLFWLLIYMLIKLFICWSQTNLNQSKHNFWSELGIVLATACLKLFWVWMSKSHPFLFWRKRTSRNPKWWVIRPILKDPWASNKRRFLPEILSLTIAISRWDSSTLSWYSWHFQFWSPPLPHHG